MPSKSRERAVLQLVYDLSCFAESNEGEAPDFCLRRSGSSWGFGVEITELFYSESEARLASIPGYFTRLISGESPRHRDDIEGLAVSEVAIYDADGVFKENSKAIIQKLPEISDYRVAILDVIGRKERKFHLYDGSMHHTNLIVLDRGGKLGGASDEDFVPLVLTREVRERLLHTPFREIFLATSNYEGKHRYFPLRMLTLLSELYLFSSSHQALDSNQEGTYDDSLRLFAKYLAWRKATVHLAPSPSGNVQVILGNTGISANDDSVQIYDLADYELPPDAKTALTTEDESSVFEQVLDLMDKQVFQTALAFKSKSESPLLD